MNAKNFAEANKNIRTGYLLIGFAILYLIFTAYIAKHGIHFVNTTITIGILILAFTIIIKSK